MMSPSIEIDDDVFDALKRHAEPFVDTPNDVLRRLLLDGARGVSSASSRSRGTDIRVSTGRRESAPARKGSVVRGANTTGRGSKRASKRTRAPSEALLSEEAYELPILRVLEEADGRLPTREAVAAVGEIVADRLKPMDHDVMDNGRKRWERRVQFTRLRLVERGLLKDNSPRGVWEISEAGREHLSRQAVAA